MMVIYMPVCVSVVLCDWYLLIYIYIYIYRCASTLVNNMMFHVANNAGHGKIGSAKPKLNVLNLS